MAIQPLNIPAGNVWDLINTETLEKTASLVKDKQIDLNGFDISAAVDSNPDHLFVKVFAIKEDEVNDNGDAFSKSELKRAAHTFVDCPVFVNHQNDDVEKARGKVVHAWYDEEAKGIYCVNMVDKTAYPQLARGIEEGYIVGTSMGAQVGYSLCSICHNKAHTADEFCTHIKNQKTRQFALASHDCKYHASSNKPEGDCPVCGCEQGKKVANKTADTKVFEWNYDINFIEDSFVVNPACHDCLVCDILNLPAVESKFAEKVEELRKVANSYEAKIVSGSITKESGRTEVDALNEAMNLLEKVTRSIMAQKQQVDMEYASDLIDVLAKVQGTTDELIEMGYTQLPSPSDSEVMFGNNSQASPPDGGGAEQISDPSQMQQQAPQMQPQAPGVQTGNLGNEVGTITRPTFSSSNSVIKEDISEQSNSLRDNLNKISNDLAIAQSFLEQRKLTLSMVGEVYEARDNNDRVTISENSDGNTYVGKWNDNNLVGWSSRNEFSPELSQLMTKDPQAAAETILSGYQKESGSMSNPNKTAAGQGVNPEQVEIITQKQLENSNLPLHGRQDSVYNTITEGDEQIGGSERSNDTTTDSNQVRSGTYEFITQSQLEEISEGHIARWSSFPEIITEKQWDEISREVSGNIDESYVDSITQSQLISIRDKHRWEEPNAVTQDQLENQKGTMPHAGDSTRLKAANSFDPKSLVRSATNAVADAIANYGLSPTDLRKAVTAFTSNPQSQIKASYLTLVNAMPSKIESRADARARSNYFSRIAGSSSNSKPVDSLLGAMGDNLGYAKAEDFLDAVNFVVTQKDVFASAERSAKQKMASNTAEDVVVDKNSQFTNAFAEINNEGLFKVCGTLSVDLGGVDATDPQAFFSAALPYVESTAGESNLVIANISVDEDSGTFEIIAKTEEIATEKEIEAFASLRSGNFKSASWNVKAEKIDEEMGYGDEEDNQANDNEAERAAVAEEAKQQRAASRQETMERTAQMQGGQMPAGLGEGGGGGSSMPTPPDAAGEMAPVENLGGAEDPLAAESDLADGDLDPAPPGTKCPVCGSEDVDVLDGRGKCNNCGSEMTYKVDIEVTKWVGTLGEGEGDDEGMEEGFEGEGFSMEDEGFDQDMPVAAYTRITDKALKKIAEQGITLGSISPYTGSSSTVELSNGERFCLNTGRKYSLAQSMKNDNWFVQWTWTPPVVDPCPSCKRLKKTFASALDQFGINDVEFEKLSLEDRGKVILSMSNKGLLNRVKTASNEVTVLKEFKKAHSFGPGDTFPTENCRELLARRFGENALALSGPDEGENLVDSVCKRLASANIYSDKIALKIASIWSQDDACIECLEDFIRSGFSAKQASLVCDQLKTKYAMHEELLAEELESPFGGEEEGLGVIEDVMESPMEESFDDMDPFAEDSSEEGFISVDIPLSVLENFDEAIDKALGEDPSDEMHHDESILPEGDAEIALPMDAVDAIDGAADEALDMAVDVADAMETAIGGESEESPIEDEGSEGGGEAVDGELGFGGEDEDEDDDGDDDDDHPGGGYPKGKEDDDGSQVVEGGHSNHSFANNSENIKKESSATISKDNSIPTQEQVMRDSDAFKPGKITKSHKVSLDLSRVAELLGKEASDSAIKQKNVQDDSDIQPVSDGSTMGHEDKLALEDPDAPSVGAGATMGNESDDLAKTDVPTVPAGGGEMGHEADQGYTAEKGHEFTGGLDGAGNSKAANRSGTLKTSDYTSDLAERLVSVATKVEEAKPVSDDEDVKPISNNKDHSNTPEGSKITPFEESDNAEVNSVPEGDSKAFMGHEQESIGDVPKAPKHQPDIPTGGGSNSDYDKNEKNNPEKQEKIKGTVIAGSNEESLTAQRNKAITVAARMLQADIITADQMPSKISELAQYNTDQISDIEKAMFGVVQKGLDTVAQGTEKPLIIAESSNKRDKNAELSDRIQGLFSLHQDNELAADDDIASIRRRR